MPDIFSGNENLKFLVSWSNIDTFLYSGGRASLLSLDTVAGVASFSLIFISFSNGARTTEGSNSVASCGLTSLGRIATRCSFSGPAGITVSNTSAVLKFEDFPSPLVSTVSLTSALSSPYFPIYLPAPA